MTGEGGPEKSVDLLAEARPDEPLSLEELAREISQNVTFSGSYAGVRVSGVQHDSRLVRPGDLFVVRRGASFDGRAFVPDAVARGAVALLTADDDLETRDVPALHVADLKAGFAYAAAAVYGHPTFALDVVGITGTNGKTTTAHLVRTAIDAGIGRPACGILGTIGHSFDGRTIEASHTTPEADELARVLRVMRLRGATHAVMEVSSIALVLGRVDAVRFRVAAFTNLTQDHLDFHGSMEAYGAAKKLLFTACEPGLAVINVDGAFGEDLAKSAKCQVQRIRTSVGATDADVAPIFVNASASGLHVGLRVPGGELEIRSRLVGLHNLENLLVAVGIASALSLDLGRVAEGLASTIGAPGRLERCDGPGDDVVVLVDYAHTPDALARVLDAVLAVGLHDASSRAFCVFGCGGDRDPSKRTPMGDAVARRAHIAVLTSDNPRSEQPEAIAEPVERGLATGGLSRIDVASVRDEARGYVVELDRNEAIRLAITNARAGDVVLIAGKGHEDYQIVGTQKLPFDDREHARQALAARRHERHGRG
jgi:UDP-N-acetylmuramoyl-L-alanyl-D-glutamate--2,6-diaminopimelate ligase